MNIEFTALSWYGFYAIIVTMIIFHVVLKCVNDFKNKKR